MCHFFPVYYLGIVFLGRVEGQNITLVPNLNVHSLIIGLVRRVFANGPGDLGSILGHIIPNTLKMVLDTSLLNTQQYKVCIKGKVEQSRKRSCTLPYTSVLKLLKREPSHRPRLRPPTLLICKYSKLYYQYLYTYIYIYMFCLVWLDWVL